MAAFEALYGRPCRSLVCWAEMGDTSMIGPELVQETTEKVALIRRARLRVIKRAMLTIGGYRYSLR